MKKIGFKDLNNWLKIVVIFVCIITILHIPMFLVRIIRGIFY